MSESTQGERLRSRLRLVPLPVAGPAPSVPAVTKPPSTGGHTDHRRVAEGLVELCAQVLRGRHPLAAVRRVATATAFGQFAMLYRRMTEGTGQTPTTLRLSRSDSGPDGTVDIVAIVQTGHRVRALSMRALRVSRSGWQLTLCQLVGRYLGP